MSFLDKLLRREKRSLTLRDPDGWKTLFGFSTTAGVDVTPEAALGHPAVLGAVRMLAETVATMPVLVYQRQADGGKARATRHPMWALLHDRPNPAMTPFTLKETLVEHLLLHGNAYLRLIRNAGGRVIALWPVHPSLVWPEVTAEGISYKLTEGTGQRALPADDVCHICMLAPDGIHGRSPILVSAETIGAALAAEEHAAGYFANAARPSGILKTNGVLSDSAAKRLKESWQQAYGRGKAGTAVLENGVEFEPVSGNAQESQLLETRQFAMRALAAALRIPPHMIEPTARGTYANTETQALEFLQFSLQPLLTRIEEALNLSLFPEGRYFCEFLADGLLRADTLSRYRAYQIGIQAGFLTPEEVRQRENLPKRGVQDGTGA
ncbi:MAG: phage portal protein [Bacillota bacterium]